jgi:hypothetical protein
MFAQILAVFFFTLGELNEQNDSVSVKFVFDIQSVNMADLFHLGA